MPYKECSLAFRQRGCRFFILFLLFKFLQSVLLISGLCSYIFVWPVPEIEEDIDSWHQSSVFNLEKKQDAYLHKKTDL